MDRQGGAELGGRAACPAERRGVGEAWGAGCAGAAVFTRVPSWGCAGGGAGGVSGEFNRAFGFS